MARFGRDLVSSLTNPGFSKSLFEVGEKIGGLPREQKVKGMLTEIATATQAGDTAGIITAYEKLGATSGDPRYTLKAAELKNEMRVSGIRSGIQRNIALLNDPTLSTTRRAAIEESIKTEAQALGPDAMAKAATAIQQSRTTAKSNADVAAQEAVSSGMTREQWIEQYGIKEATRYDAALAKAQATQNQLKTNKKTEEEDTFNEALNPLLNQFELLMQGPTDQIDQEAAATIVNQIQNLAVANNQPVEEYVDLFTKRFEQKVTTEINTRNRNRQETETQKNLWADSVANQLSNFEDPIAELQAKIDSAPNQMKPLWEEKLSYIKNKIDDSQTARKEIKEHLSVGKLSDTAVTFLEDPANKAFFTGVDAVENAYADLQRFEAKVSKGGNLTTQERANRRQHLKLITEKVAQARDAKREQSMSEPVAELNTQDAIRSYVEDLAPFRAGAFSRFFSGGSVYDAVVNSRSAAMDGDKKSGELYNRIEDTLKREYMLNPNLPAEEAFSIIKQTAEQAGVEASGEEAFEARRKEAELELNQNRSLISDKIKRQNPKGKNESESEYAKRIDALSEDKDVVTKAAIEVEEDLATLAEKELRERRALISRAQASSFMGM